MEIETKEINKDKMELIFKNCNGTYKGILKKIKKRRSNKKMLQRNGDGTGPRGQGPRTGRGQGNCPR